MFKRLLLFIIALLLLLCFKLNYQTLSIPSHSTYRAQIYRDQQGIPRVFGRTKQAISYAVGYASAQDVLWSLHIRKKMMKGEMAQLFGKDLLQSDMEMRNFGFTGVGQMNEKLLGNTERQYLQAYADGINDYARGIKVLPLEFYVFWTKWDDWTVEDSMINLAFLGFSLDFDWMFELARQRLLETVGFELARKIIPFGQQNLYREVTIINDEELKQQGMYKEYNSSYQSQILKLHWASKNLTLGHVKLPQNKHKGTGSNAWVVGGEHTKSGKPILSNDPHLLSLIPSIFYPMEFNLVNQVNQIDTRVFGWIIHGLPSITLGVSKNKAWGSTASYADNKDIYVQTIREDDTGKMQYLFEGEWRDFRVREERFKIKLGQEVVTKFYHTHRGPLLKHFAMDLHFKYGYPLTDQYRQNHALSIDCSMYDPDPTSIKGLLDLTYANTLEDFQSVSEMINSPNIDSGWIFGDGMYGYKSIGRIPKRKIPEMGSFIKDGSTSMYDMTDYLKGAERPQLRNPKKGYIGMTNNKFAQDGFESRTSLHQISPGRCYRLEKLLKGKIQKKEKFDLQDMIKMQLDVRDEFLSEAFPYVLKALDTVRELWSTPQTERYYKLLLNWDYYMPKDSVQTSIYHVWQRHFQLQLLKAYQFSSQQHQALINHAFFEVYQMKLFEKMGKGELGHEQYLVCQHYQNQNLTQTHPCIYNAAMSFRGLPQELSKLFGTHNVQDFKWGKIHKMVFKSIPWSDIPYISKIFGRESEVGGNSRTLNVAILSHQAKNYNAFAGPVARMVTDLNRTLYSYDTGTNSRPWSPFYDNFVGKDMYVEYKHRNPLKENTAWVKSFDSL